MFGFMVAILEAVSTISSQVGIMKTTGKKMKIESWKLSLKFDQC